MQTHRFTGADGIVLNCLDYGGAGKTPILFIHGGSAQAHWWDFVAPAFIDRFHVLALDQRGHGDSEWTDEWGYGTRHYVADLHAIITRSKFGAPILVGHSMGGHNVMVYAGLYSDTIRAMVAVDSPATYPGFAVNFLRGMAERPARRFDSLEEACDKFRTIPETSLAAAAVLRQVARNSFRRDEDGKWSYKMDRRTMMREPINAWHNLPNIKRPALFVRAGTSALDMEQVKKVVARMPHGHLAVVPDSHHHVPLDNPKGLIAVLDEFLREIE